MSSILLFCIWAVSLFVAWSWGYASAKKAMEKHYAKMLDNMFEYQYSSTENDYEYSVDYVDDAIETSMKAPSGIVYDLDNYRHLKKNSNSYTSDGIMAWTLAWSEQDGKYIKVSTDPTDIGDED